MSQDQLQPSHPSTSFEKINRLRTCEEIILGSGRLNNNLFNSSWQEAAAACLEVERDRLWEAAGFESNRAYWVEKKESSGVKGHVTYERVLQLIGATKVIEELKQAGIDPTFFQSERSLRILGNIPDENRVEIAKALIVEIEATGRTITETLVQLATEDITAGLSFLEIQEQFSQYGKFERLTPTGRKDQYFRFVFKQPDFSTLLPDLKEVATFSTLPKALNWLNANIIKKKQDLEEYQEEDRRQGQEQENVNLLKGSPYYPLSQCAQESYMDESLLANWVKAIYRKKQAILYGPPGTGKTYLAKHLARHLISGSDGIQSIVQFHPAYTYEDFVQGIRPQQSKNGGLDYPIVPGRFLDFCEKARSHQGTCVFMIDEINRGLTKLIEPT